jgi:asparagine synthase (glutamine-hydrolysing)
VVQAGEKMGKLARLSGCTSPEQIHLDLATLWRPGERVTRADEVPRMRSEGPHAFLDDIAPLERALWFDTIQGLPGDMLVKVDRATMSVGLEARQPLLDHRLYDASWQIPAEFKIRHGVGKWPLRQLLARYVPRPLWERPKSGFSVPLDAWLRGPLRAWAEELLSEKKLDERGVFRSAPVREALRAHLSGKQNHGARLWAVLSAQAWLEKVG